MWKCGVWLEFRIKIISETWSQLFIHHRHHLPLTFTHPVCVVVVTTSLSVSHGCKQVVKVSKAAHKDLQCQQFTHFDQDGFLLDWSTLSSHKYTSIQTPVKLFSFSTKRLVLFTISTFLLWPSVLIPHTKNLYGYQTTQKRPHSKEISYWKQRNTKNSKSRRTNWHLYYVLQNLFIFIYF